MLVILLNFFVQAQSPVDKWELHSYTQETHDGKKPDMVKDFAKEYTCITSAVINFSADGEITGQADKCPAEMQQPGIGTKWKIAAKNNNHSID